MKVLGIDPGMAILGWCVLEFPSKVSTFLEFGCIQTLPHQPLTNRLTQIFTQLKNLIELHRPDSIALETLYFVKNAKTLAQVGHTRGVILLAAGQEGLEVFEYAPRQIKMALTGFGGADKRQMQLMVQRMLKLKEVPKPDDAADAVAVALCHAQFSASFQRSVATV